MGRRTLLLPLALMGCFLLCGSPVHAQGMCNPPCPGGETCTRSGECIPPFHPAMAPAKAPVVAPVPVAQVAPVQPAPLDDATGKARYDTAKRRRTIGLPLLIVGVVTAGVGMIMGMSGEFGADSEVAEAGAIAIIVGGAFFIPGLIMTIKGTKGLRRYKQYASDGHRPMPRHLVLAPTRLTITF